MISFQTYLFSVLCLSSNLQSVTFHSLGYCWLLSCLSVRNRLLYGHIWSSSIRLRSFPSWLLKNIRVFSYFSICYYQDIEFSVGSRAVICHFLVFRQTRSYWHISPPDMYYNFRVVCSTVRTTFLNARESIASPVFLTFFKLYFYISSCVALI